MRTSDHLGSTSVTADADGILLSRTLYSASPLSGGLRTGEVRYSSGALPTDYREAYAGQYSNTADFGLMYYRACWLRSVPEAQRKGYDPSLGRFAQADTIVPGAGNPMAWDRYSYSLNNPVVYADPSGHFPLLFALGIVLIGGGVIGGNVAHEILTSPAIDDPSTPSPTSSDMSSWLIDRIQETSSSQTVSAMNDAWAGNPIEKAGALKAWVSLVRSKGAWDFKPDIKKAGLEGQITLGGIDTDSQSVANLFYGFIGSDVGFDSNLLELGAGTFQMWDNRKNPEVWGGLETWGDDPFDNWWIQFCIYLHDLYEDDMSKLTPEELARVLAEYTEQNGNPPSSPLGE